MVPIPTPTDGGADILTVTADPTYPLPALLIVSVWIVPAAETVAVIAAETGSDAPEIIKALKSISPGITFS